MELGQGQKAGDGASSQYALLRHEYNKSGITYKANEVLHKIGDIKGYPYLILLEVTKILHLNQLEVIFLAHFLKEEECSYQNDPALYQTEMDLPELAALYDKMTDHGDKPIPIKRDYSKAEIEDEEGDPIAEVDESAEYWSLEQLRRLYIYLLVIGYSVKYYLNDQTKPYEQEIRRRYPYFFSSIFTVWVDKYSAKVLRTNPRKINQFYIELFMNEDIQAVDNAELDCQYGNYNEIVEELIKATTDADDVGHDDGDFPSQN